MGKTTGFLEIKRSLPLARSPKERVNDWHEFHGHHAEPDLQKQGARCMNCGIPFCHTGSYSAGFTTGCPVHNLIPDWNDLVYRGRWYEAYVRLSQTNNFPEFTGRVCPAPCESSCVLGLNDEPVTIKEIECAIIDRAFEEGWIVPSPPSSRTGKRVAIIGSGPAGLACADELNKAGHSVIVFERDDRIGGLLMYGIPNMKLEKTLVDRRVNLLREEGIEFRTNATIGGSIPTAELQKDFDAVVICAGVPQPRDLDVEGRELSGIHFAMELLTENTKRVLAEDTVEPTIDLTGKNVIVIGGGDTGTDCVATALRRGCKSLTQFEIMAKAPERDPNHDDWLAAVRYFQTDYGQEEFIDQFGTDPRAYGILTKKFIGDAGQLTAIETVNAEFNNGKLIEKKGTKKTWKADVVLLAMGFTGVGKPNFVEDLGVELTTRNTIAVDANKQTSAPGVFAAGDCERGQSLIVWAIADGRKAADGVDRYLREPK